MSDRKINLNELYRYVMPDLPKCPAPLIDQAILTVIEDWCHDTQCWALELDPMYVRAGNADYDLDGWDTRMAQIDAVTSVVMSGRELIPGTEFTRPENAIIRLATEPTSSLAKGLIVTVSLKPARTATQTDADLFDDYCSAWSDGVQSQLMLEPGKTWSNPNVGLYKRGLYEAARVNCKGHVMRKRTNAHLILDTRRFV